jgi:hypothetical protein
MTTRHVTKTGRAVQHGRTTRKSLSVGRPKGVKPLPLRLQCHPQALHRTTMNPGCEKFPTPTGGLVAIAPFSGLLCAVGHGLSTAPDRITLEVEGPLGSGTWYAHDTAYAMRWAKGARLLGLTVKVFINEPKLG